MINIEAGTICQDHVQQAWIFIRALKGFTKGRWQVDPARIVVTAGASAALQLVTLALFEAGDEVLMPDPSYPCNRHFVAAAGATARLVPSTAAQRFQLDAASVCAHWSARTRGVLLASPSNPTGTSIEPQELRAIVQAVRARAGVTIVDEIYLPLSYDTRFGGSALALGEDVISVNSFSKYFSMTGWRLGWLVLPPALVEPVERLAQNLYICPSAVAQHAAVACFESQTLALCEQRRGELFEAAAGLGLPGGEQAQIACVGFEEHGRRSAKARNETDEEIDAHVQRHAQKHRDRDAAAQGI
jgi:aspartate/methionine/tyrosine aminotransferase